MREIKFRCWNAHGKVMHSWCELVEKNKIHLLANQKPSYVIMQYTGLKDKNGVEIYEGDVVRAYHSDWDDFEIATMEWNDDGCWTLGRYWKDGVHDWYSVEQYETGDLEVLGNVHQNPELLK